MGFRDKRGLARRRCGGRGATPRPSFPPNQSRRFSRIPSISVVTSMKVESNATTSIRESFDRLRNGPAAETCSLRLSELIEAGNCKKTRSRLADDCGSSRPRDLVCKFHGIVKAAIGSLSAMICQQHRRVHRPFISRAVLQVRLEFETPQPRRLRCVSSFVPSPSRRALPASLP